MNKGDLSEGQLVAQITAGDPAALEEIYERYAAHVMGLAFRITNDKDLAEDIVQEVFWRIWRIAESYQAQRGSFAAWLLTITRNQAIDAVRRRNARPQTLLKEEDDWIVEQIPDPDSDVPELAWRSLQRSQVKQALAALPEVQRQVIELAFFAGMTRKEIAEMTGEPLGTIHTRARLGLQKLNEALRALSVES